MSKFLSVLATLALFGMPGAASAQRIILDFRPNPG